MDTKKIIGISISSQLIIGELVEENKKELTIKYPSLLLQHSLTILHPFIETINVQKNKIEFTFEITKELNDQYKSLIFQIQEFLSKNTLIETTPTRIIYS